MGKFRKGLEAKVSGLFRFFGRGLLTLSPDRNRGRAANPTTLLTRFAEELRRAPGAGGWEGGGWADSFFVVHQWEATNSCGGKIRFMC